MQETLPDRRRKWRSCSFLLLDHGRKRCGAGETMGQTRVPQLSMQPEPHGGVDAGMGLRGRLRVVVVGAGALPPGQALRADFLAASLSL